MARRLIIDTANLLFRVNAMNAKQSFGSDEERAGLALHTSFQVMHKYFRKFKPDQIIFSFEGTNNWRKTYTMGEWGEPITPNVYKANRVKDKSIEPFLELIGAFHEVMRDHTTAVCMHVDCCEGDDVIAGATRRLTAEGDEVIIVSADKDFVQLLKYPGVRLIDPATGKDRECEDLDYWIFEKCVRGDAGDNVHSAFPRVRKTKIVEAFQDDFKRQNMMEETWTGKMGPDGEEPKTYRVGDMFVENKLLMDLECQPDHVKAEIEKGLDEAFNNPGQYNNFKFMRFLGQFGLNAIGESIHLYTDMLSAKISDEITAQRQATSDLLEF